MTIALNVQKLWDNWQRSQRDNNIHQPAVQGYLVKIALGQKLPSITIEGIVEEEAGEDEEPQIRIRTADGRHRLTAAHQAGLETIDVDDTPAARLAQELFLL